MNSNTTRWIAAAALIIIACWIGRYEIVGTGYGVGYRLDRWTGAVVLVSPYGGLRPLEIEDDEQPLKKKPWEMDWGQ